MSDRKRPTSQKHKGRTQSQEVKEIRTYLEKFAGGLQLSQTRSLIKHQ